ncbi:MAG TPA: hypothetical protein VIW45_11295 [Vicinamibacterales bacterium]|jgi:hypothetical protein
MSRPSDRQGDRHTPPSEPAGRASKKPYRAPRVKKYGNLPDLALVKGGTAKDGGNIPPSKG